MDIFYKLWRHETFDFMRYHQTPPTARPAKGLQKKSELRFVKITKLEGQWWLFAEVVDKTSSTSKPTIRRQKEVEKRPKTFFSKFSKVGIFDPFIECT